MTSNPTKGQKYLAQLKAEFWGVMLAAGAHTEHRYDMAEDGKRIIRPILNSSPIRLRIQTEMIEKVFHYWRLLQESLSWIN